MEGSCQALTQEQARLRSLHFDPRRAGAVELDPEDLLGVRVCARGNGPQQQPVCTCAYPRALAPGLKHFGYSQHPFPRARCS